MAQDSGFSVRKQGFDSPWGYWGIFELPPPSQVKFLIILKERKAGRMAGPMDRYRSRPWQTVDWCDCPAAAAAIRRLPHNAAVT